MKISLQKFIKGWLAVEGCELSLRLNRFRNKVDVSVLQNLPPGVSENKLVRREQHCQTINTYRNGRKTGMKLITYVEIDFDAIPDSETGETDEHPITGHSLDIGSDNDPPDRMHTNTKSNEG